MSQKIRIIFSNPAIARADFLDKIPALFEQGALIYNARNQIRVITYQGETLNIKKFCIPPIFNRILYSIGLRTPKAKTAYANALKIRERGFHTPLPYGYILEKENRLLGHSYLVTQQLDGYQTLRIRDLPKSLIRRTAEYLAHLHEKGMLHRDLTANNILYKQQGNDYLFSLVDVNQFYFQKKPLRAIQVLPYMIQLFPQHKDLLHFITAYAYCRKIDSKSCYRTAVQLRNGRTAYSRLKKILKKIPGARLLQTKRLDVHHK